MNSTSKYLTTLLAGACFAVSAASGQITVAVFPMTGASVDASVGGDIATFGFSGTPNYSDVAATTGFADAVNQAGGWGAGSFWELSLDTTGFEGISISAWGQRSSNTGPAEFRVDVSYDAGENFATIVSDYLVNNANAGYSNPGITLSDLADNNPSVIVRWINISNTAVNEGSINTTQGTSRFTDFSVTAAIPEPSTYAAIVGALFLGLVIYRRRRG